MTTWVSDQERDTLLETLLWQDINEHGETLDELGYTIEDIAKTGDYETLIEQYREFKATNETLIDEYIEITDCDFDDIAIDFVLTRNGHGTGYWDNGAGEVGDNLSWVAQNYGDASLWCLDDETLEVHA